MKLYKLFCVGVLVAAGCAAASEEPGGDLGGQGKADDNSDDGELRCSYDIASALGSTSDDLDAAAMDRKMVTIDDVQTLSELELRQLYQTAVHLEMMQPDEDVDTVFNVPDEGQFELLVLSSDGRQYDWVRFYAGDNEVGVVFEGGTQQIVAEIGDGDIMGCEGIGVPIDPPPVEPPPGGGLERVSCDWDYPSPYETSQDLRDRSSSERKITIDDMDMLPEGTALQLFKANFQLGYLGADDDFDVVFDTADEGTYWVHTTGWEDEHTWIEFYVGDTEVGVVFQGYSLDIIAEIGDGDILGCEPAE